MKKNLWLAGLFCVLLSGCTLPISSETAEILVTPGEGFGDIKVNQSTMQDIVKACGRDYKTDTFYNDDHKSVFSFRLNYKSKGMRFYFYPNNPACFNINLLPPFKARTKEGIVLNKSTFKDVVNAYQNVEWYFSSGNMTKEYKGIRFSRHFDGKLPISEADLLPYLDKKVTAFEIF